MVVGINWYKVMTNPTGYIPPSKEELLLKDFLSWCGKEHGAILVDVTRPDVNNRTNYKFVSHIKVVQEYLVSKEGTAL